MKIIVIDGIQNTKNSMTQVLLDNCLHGIKSKNPKASVKIIKLRETPIEFCVGCKLCGTDNGKAIGTCVHKDEMQKILPAILKADRVIFASPIYSFTASSSILRFVERTLPLAIYPHNKWPKARNKPKAGKKGLVLLASDCPAPLNWLFGITWHASILLKMLCRSTGCSKTKVITAGGMRYKKTWYEKFCKKAYQCGLDLV